jgi:hypothetical protein
VNEESRVRFPETTKMVYRSMEGHCATNAEMKVRLFLNQQWLVAQWKMYPAFNRKVVGSSPTGPTNQFVNVPMWQYDNDWKHSSTVERSPVK